MLTSHYGQEAPINTNDRLLLEFIAAETARAGQCHASIRHMAVWLNMQKNTAQKRVSALLAADLIQHVHRGGMRGSASYTVTGGGLAALQAFQVPQTWATLVGDLAVDTERSGTWYKAAQVPDAMRDTRYRGPWELWRSLPHSVWFTPDDVLPYVTAVTTRSVRNWTKALANLAIPLAEWATAGTQFRLLDADQGVFGQLRLVQEEEAAAQGKKLVSRADLERAYMVERIRADEVLEQRKRTT